MSVIIQSGDRSMTASSGCSPALPIATPSALTSGDMLCILVSSHSVAPPSIVGQSNWLSSSVFDANGEGIITLFYRSVLNQAAVDATPSVSSILLDPAGEEDVCANVFCFRVTGADHTRFLEDSKGSIGSIPADGKLTIPAFDPEHRSDNVILYVATQRFKLEQPEPSATVGLAAPIASHAYFTEDDSMDSIRTGLFSRDLVSSDPTGDADISVTVETHVAFGGAFMFRSLNNPPAVGLPESWTGEVGRQIAVSASVIEPDGTPVSCAWSQVGGPPVSELGSVYSRTITFTPAEPGVYEFLLVATDVDGARTEATTQVIVPTGRSGPVSVIESTGWVDQDESPVIDPASLGDMDDGSFARTEDLPIGEPLTVGLPPIYGGAAITLVIRGAATNPSPAISRSVTLRQADGAIIAERQYLLHTSMTSYVFTTTREETAFITSRSALTVTIVDEVA